MYIHIHVLLKNWLTIADDLSIYLLFPSVTSSRSNDGTLKISNQPVVGLITVIQARLKLLFIIAPPSCCCLIDLLYVPTRSTFNKPQGFSSETLLSDRRPYMVFLFSNCSHILHELAYRSACVKRNFQYHNSRSLIPLGRLIYKRDQSSTSMCRFFSVYIFLSYHIKLTQSRVLLQ